ncbi:unnamed protein product [Umbelopsis sp. WA50703]
MLVSVTNNSARYGAVCLSVAGVFVINPVVNAWLTGNIAPGMKKSVATAMAVSANNAAGLVGSNIYLSSDAPTYIRGHTVNLGFTALFIVLVTILRVLLWRENKMRQKQLEELEDRKVLEDDPRMGDRRLDFRYAL